MKEFTLKNFTLALILAMAFNYVAHSAVDVDCKRDKRGWYKPVNEKAKVIANYLNVKTCSGDKFMDKVKELGLTTNSKRRIRSKADLKKLLGLTGTKKAVKKN